MDTVNDPVPEYEPVPPLAVTVTVVVPPLQLIGVKVADAVNTVGSVMVTLAVEMQFLLSVTVAVYVPAESPLAVCVV